MQAVKPLQLFQASVHTLSSVKSFGGWEAVKLARQSGAIRLAKKPSASPGDTIAAEQPRSCTLCHLLRFLPFREKSFTTNKHGSLNETVFDDPDAQTRMAIRLYLISCDGAFDRSEPAVNWSIGETHDKADYRRKLHTSRHAQV